MTLSRQDKRLIRKLRRRDEDAFRQLVLQYQHKVFNIVYRMIGDRQEAEDISQEVFVTVFKSIDSFRGESKFSTWLFRIATNQCKNRLKYLGRRARGKTQPIDDMVNPPLASPLTGASPQPDKVAAGKELESIVQRALATLEDEHRVIIVLRDIEGLPYAEIADITGLNVGTVKSRLHRGRVALKDEVRRQYEQ